MKKEIEYYTDADFGLSLEEQLVKYGYALCVETLRDDVDDSFTASKALQIANEVRAKQKRS